MAETMVNTSELVKRFLAVLALCLVALFGCSPGYDESHKIPSRVELIRETQAIAGEIVVAASKETYVDHLDDSTRIDQEFAGKTGGVWCGGAVEIAKDYFEGFGWDVATLSYGIENRWTHMVLLVLTQDGWLISDPYLGNVWLESYPKSVETIKGGRIPSIESFGVERWAVFEERPLSAKSSWLIGRATRFPLKCESSSSFWSCLVAHDSYDYANGHFESQLFLNSLEEFGLPRDISSGVLLPFGVWVSPHGWIEVDSPDDVLRLIGSEANEESVPLR